MLQTSDGVHRRPSQSLGFLRKVLVTFIVFACVLRYQSWGGFLGSYHGVAALRHPGHKSPEVLLGLRASSKLPETAGLRSHPFRSRRPQGLHGPLPAQRSMQSPRAAPTEVSEGHAEKRALINEPQVLAVTPRTVNIQLEQGLMATSPVVNAIAEIIRKASLNRAHESMPQLGFLFLSLARLLRGDQVKMLVLVLAKLMSDKSFKCLLFHIAAGLPPQAHKALVRYASVYASPNVLRIRSLAGIATKVLPRRMSRSMVRIWLNRTSPETLKRITTRALRRIEPGTAEWLVNLAFDHLRKASDVQRTSAPVVA